MEYYFSENLFLPELKRLPTFKMKPGGWYLIVFVTTFLYFYIYAVNYVRGAKVPRHPEELKTHYIEGEVKEHLDRIVREAVEDVDIERTASTRGS